MIFTCSRAGWHECRIIGFERSLKRTHTTNLLARARVTAVRFVPKMSRRILVTSETPLNIVDPYYCHSFPSYSNEFGTDKDYLKIRFTETMNVIEKMDGIVDADFVINRVRGFDSCETDFSWYVYPFNNVSCSAPFRLTPALLISNLRC